MLTPRHVIVGTAGHVDHGKTALVKALTGIDTDTQPEEKARGVTIDVGFAYWQEHVTVIDVPGHERFVKNAVTGASAIDLALFVVAADDGVMPQTREHLAILQLLGIRRGVVALTKTDLVEPDWAELVTEELRELFADTFLATAPIVPVSAITGAGLDELRVALEVAMAAVEARADRGVFRMPVDRIFSVAGFGTVVAGTVLSGRVQARDELVLQPAGRALRVRGVQVHGADVPMASIGQRAAVNLADLDVDAVARGDTLTAPGWFPATYMLDARLELAANTGVRLEHRDRVRLHLGPREVLARVVLLDAEELEPGSAGYVQFHLETPAVAAHGDRFVIRRYSPAQTLGGGFVLDPATRKHRRRQPDVLEVLRDLDTASTPDAAQAFLRAAGVAGRTAQEVAALLGAGTAQTAAILGALVEAARARNFRERGAQRYLHALAWSALTEATRDALAAFHREAPLKPGLGREALRQLAAPHAPEPVFDAVLAVLVTDGTVCAETSWLRLASHRVKLPASLEDLRRRLGECLREGGTMPPDEDELAAQLQAAPVEVAAVVEVMQGRDEIVRLADRLLFDANVLEALRARLVGFLEAHGPIEVSAFRELAGTSRKYAVPLLNHFDSLGVTRREGAVRVLAAATGTLDSAGGGAGV